MKGGNGGFKPEPFAGEARLMPWRTTRRWVMKTAIRYAALSWIVALALVPAYARAQDKPPLKPPYEVTLDIDHDGKMDRAVLVEDPATGNGDLYIYLGTGAEKFDPTRKPAIVKKTLTAARILRFESDGKGSLIVMSGCGGCSNDYATTLTIVYRRDAFLVGGVSYDWDTRSGVGSCSFDFLTGKGIRSRGLAKGKPFTAKLAPVNLADWSDEKRPKACR